MKLNHDQYNCIGIVAKHCDYSKLCVAENEASNFDLLELFCDYWYNILEIEKEIKDYQLNNALPIPENYESKLKLLNGGTFDNCKGNKVPFQGVYDLLAYYSYSRYIILNGFSDTPNGIVTKTNEFSIPKSLKELELFASKYRNMGLTVFKKIENFLCSENEIFDYNNCENKCSCGSDGCDKTTKNKGYGFRSSNITK